MREGAESGTLEAAEQELIERVFDFADCAAHEIMTPRTEIVAVDIDMSIDAAIERVVESGYSRIPVYRDSLDTVAGILYAKDLLRAAQQKASDPSGPAQLNELLRPPVFVLEHQRVSSVLHQFKQTRTHLALVVDEYGQVDGLITLEDVLEELAGEIADEYDEADTMVVRRADGSYLVNGLLSYADAEDRIGLPPRSEGHVPKNFDTVAGLILALLEHIPTVGETVTWRDWHFEVVDMDGVRIDQVLVQPPKISDQSRDEAALAMRAVLPPPVDSQTNGDEPRDQDHAQS